MAKKKSVEKPARELTKRQLSHYKKQKRRQRIIFISGVSIIAAVIVIVLLGWFFGEYRPAHRTVVRVNDTEFSAGYYVDALSLAGKDQSAEYLQNMADLVMRDIKQAELMRQGAMELGISVSDNEIKEAMKDTALPMNDAARDSVRAQLLQEKLNQEYFDSQVPTSDRQVNIMAMLLGSEDRADDVRDRLLNGEDFSVLAGELSLDAYTQENKGELGWHPEAVLKELVQSSVPGDYAFGSEPGMLSQPRYDAEAYKQFGYWLVNVLEKPFEDSAQVQALLLSSEEEAKNVKARLEAGEDLAVIAGELSQYEESRKQKGELGVVEKDEMPAVVDEYIFNPETAINSWSEPILDETQWTQGGYWLIKVIDKDVDRELQDLDRRYLLSVAFNEWLSMLWVNNDEGIDDSMLTPEIKQWALEKVLSELSK